MTTEKRIIDHLEKAHRLLAVLDIPMREYRPASGSILTAINQIKKLTKIDDVEQLEQAIERKPLTGF